MSESQPQEAGRATGRTSVKPVAYPFAALIIVALVIGFRFLSSEIQRIRDASRKPQCKTHLKQIGLALHNYHDEFGCFPPAFVADDKGRPIHSWRVLILPWLDQKALYDEYLFDEPWDGPNNSRLAERMMEVYSCPRAEQKLDSPERFFTSYVAVVGSETAWPGTESISTSDIKDGTETTVIVVEVTNSGIHWMEPRDLHVVQMSRTVNGKAGQGISGPHKDGAYVLRADGAVLFVRDGMSSAGIDALLTIDGEEPAPAGIE